MARTRKSKASVILQYFQTEELGVAQTVYDLVSQVMKDRAPKATKSAKTSKGKRADLSATATNIERTLSA